MKNLIEEIRLIHGHPFGSFNWWMGMQTTKLACVTGLAIAKKADPIPDHVPTLDERNERDYQAAYVQVERDWRRDTGMHEHQPVFGSVCALMNLLQVPSEFNDKCWPTDQIARLVADYAPSSNADEADEIFGSPDERQTFADVLKARKMQDLIEYSDRIVALITATRESDEPLSGDANLDWLPRMVVSAVNGQKRSSKRKLLDEQISADEARFIVATMGAVEAHAV